ncbi:hypothetical protein TMatcc_010732 [Talaromyces marneffei ATCC 18224]
MLNPEATHNGSTHGFNLAVSGCESYLLRVFTSFPMIAQNASTIFLPIQVECRKDRIPTYPSSAPQIQGLNQDMIRFQVRVEPFLGPYAADRRLVLEKGD